jgi:regulator of protease activity HflC (stomatin/prohibitin superfamily)
MVEAHEERLVEAQAEVALCQSANAQLEEEVAEAVAQLEAVTHQAEAERQKALAQAELLPAARAEADAMQVRRISSITSFGGNCDNSRVVVVDGGFVKVFKIDQQQHRHRQSFISIGPRRTPCRWGYFLVPTAQTPPTTTVR